MLFAPTFSPASATFTIPLRSSAIFNSLWNTGFFEDIRFEREATPKGWILHIYVKEKPRIKEINYVGINAISKSDILDRFKQDKVALSVESQYDPTKVKHAEVTLRQLEAEHGHQFSTIRTEIRPIPPSSVGITFVVREGPKVKVGRIRFQGNRHVKSRELRSAMHFMKPIGVPHSIFLEKPVCQNLRRHQTRRRHRNWCARRNRTADTSKPTLANRSRKSVTLGTLASIFL